MTAGTSPAWRSLRAIPVPLPERGVALSETVAIQFFPYQLVLNFAAKPEIVGSYSRVAASTLPYRRSGPFLYVIAREAGDLLSMFLGRPFELQQQIPRPRRGMTDGTAQSNNEETDCSACVYFTAFAISSPTDSTANWGGRRDSGSAIVSVTATSAIGESVRRCLAGPEKSAWVAQI